MGHRSRTGTVVGGVGWVGNKSKVSPDPDVLPKLPQRIPTYVDRKRFRPRDLP